MSTCRIALWVLALSTVLTGCAAQISGTSGDGKPDPSSPDVPPGTPPTPAATPTTPGAPPPAATPTPMASVRADLCGNGIDDDADGEVDEGCGCTVGTQQSCYIGPPGTGGVGPCHPGLQNCVPDGEFPSWGPCEGSIVPHVEIIENGKDDDCDGTTDEPDGICIPDEFGQETGDRCHDGRDTDCDGMRDCDDPSCLADNAAACPGGCQPTESVCSDGRDDDCDGAIDCDDGECLADPACAPPPPTCTPTGAETGARCHDGDDNDCNGLRNCDDPSCLADPAAACPGGCQPTETCTNGGDDDCDGLADCADPSCGSDASCRPALCPGGGSPVFRRRPPMTEASGSYIAPGDNGPMMPMACEPAPPIACDRSSVAVETAPGSFACVAPPAECGGGMSPEWAGSGWVCSKPCELFIHYGAIYGFVTVCAPRPTLTCDWGLSPTFVYETSAWECRPTCDNGLYDIHYVDGGLVCIPC